MIRIFTTVLFFIFLQNIFSQPVSMESLSIVFHNCHSFYDILDDPGVIDDKYTPDGELRWDRDKYNKRTEDIATLLTEIDSKELPGIIVLSGIEKVQIAKDIFSSRKLRRSDYTIAGGVSYPGSGIAIAIKKGVAELLESRVIFPEINPELAEVSIISYNRIRLGDGALYHLFINEWPSGSLDGMSGETIRKYAAASLRKEIDLILNFERDARIIVIGSFNDEPTNASIMTILNASGKRKNLSDRDLFNPFYDMHNIENRGTILVNGLWQMYDFIIVSPSLLSEGTNFYTEFTGGRIADQSPTFGPTYRGSEYAGGSGSHLPVIIRLSRTIEK